MYSARQMACMVSLLIATGICRADAGGHESFLDAQTIIDTWQSNYARIDSYKVRVSKRVITGADPCELTYSCVDLIEDRGRFHVWMTNSALGFDEKEKVIISSFNGHQSKDFRGAIQEARIVSGSLHPQGVAFVNPLLSVLGSERVMIADPSVTTMSPLRRSLKEEFPEGIPGITYDYRVAKEKGRVVVRPELEVVAGVSCHVVDVEGFSPQVSGTTWWFAHERSMLRVKSSHRYRDGETNSMEVLELAKVDTETGALWYPRKAIRQQKREGRDRLVEIEVPEFVPHIKVPDSTFDVAFPPGTRVRDSVAGMIYRVGEGPRADSSAIGESPSPESPGPVGRKRGSLRDGNDQPSDRTAAPPGDANAATPREVNALAAGGTRNQGFDASGRRQRIVAVVGGGLAAVAILMVVLRGSRSTRRLRRDVHPD